jgi:hypothetical protein
MGGRMSDVMVRPVTVRLPRLSSRDGFGLAGMLLGLLLVGAAATGGWFAARSASREHRMRESAAILAEHGLREFAAAARTLDLLELAIGADSIVHKARVFADDQMSGTIAVQVARTGEAAFTVKSTGRLDRRDAPFVCSYEVTWRLDRETDPVRALDPQDGPMCNGARRSRPAGDTGVLLQRLGR